jgi:hypothetical protein
MHVSCLIVLRNELDKLENLKLVGQITPQYPVMRSNTRCGRSVQDARSSPFTFTTSPSDSAPFTHPLRPVDVQCEYLPSGTLVPVYVNDVTTTPLRAPDLSRAITC